LLFGKKTDRLRALLPLLTYSTEPYNLGDTKIDAVRPFRGKRYIFKYQKYESFILNCHATSEDFETTNESKLFENVEVFEVYEETENDKFKFIYLVKLTGKDCKDYEKVKEEIIKLWKHYTNQ
jgi:hypothetical protein